MHNCKLFTIFLVPLSHGKRAIEYQPALVQVEFVMKVSWPLVSAIVHNVG